MTSLRDAAQQALEALTSRDFGWTRRFARDRAIDALKAALVEDAMQKFTDVNQELMAALGCDHCNHPLYAATRCRVCGRVTEPVQEPAAWRWGYRSVTTGEMDWRGYVETDAHPSLRSPEIIMQPLYAAPPQRKPLTEEEIKQLLFESAGMTVTFSAVDLSLARAIERAHGIGGSDA